MRHGLRGPEIGTRRIDWRCAWRVIHTRRPPIDLFERVCPDSDERSALIELEVKTNPRVRDEVGEIEMVPRHRRVFGPNASWVMAPFTHINRSGSRFSDGSYGVYYAAKALETAIIETGYHFGRFAADSSDPPRTEPMRVLKGTAACCPHDLESLAGAERNDALDPKSYFKSRSLAAALRTDNSDGILYPSVRHQGGNCIAIFWPNVISVPIQERQLEFEWNGQVANRYFDHLSNEWKSFPVYD
jgi:hypothetical protein